jgi:YD repeat-containing protein
VTSTFAYDSHGNMLTVTHGTAVTQMTYTPEGFLASNVDPSGVTRTFTYDANGNQTGSGFTWVNPQGKRTSSCI